MYVSWNFNIAVPKVYYKPFVYPLPDRPT